MKAFLKKIYSSLPFKKQVFSLLKHLPLPESIYKHLYFEDIFEVKFDSHHFLMRHYGFQLENEIFWKGLTNGWEKVSLKLWIELSKDSQYILDIGANTGIYSLVSKSINSKAQVYAFEPVKRVYEKLCANNSLNAFDIKSYELALSDKDGEAVIYDTPTPHVYSVAVNKNISGLSNTIETKIRTQKLSSFIQHENITRIDLIKIDVETHEPEVLDGMGEYLELFKPSLLIEVLSDEIGAKIEDILKNIDYLYFTIDEIHAPKQVQHITKSGFYNYFICSSSIAKKLKLIN